MSSTKNSALTLLMIGSILLFISFIWNMFSSLFFYDVLYLPPSYIIYWFLYFIALLLLMIGFIQYREEQSKRSKIGAGTVLPTDSQIQSVSVRFCPKCRKQIPIDAQFCPFCGWQVEGQKRKKN